MNMLESHRAGHPGLPPLLLTREPPVPAQSTSKLMHRAAAVPETGKTGELNPRRSTSSRIFFAGFGLSFLLLVIEYLTAGEFPGWFLLVPSNPTILLAALVAHQVESLVGSRSSDEAFFGTLVVESALWWYILGALVAVLRRHRAASLVEVTESRLRRRSGGWVG